MDLTGILAVTFIFGGGSCFLLAISPIGRAIADRIRGRAQVVDDRVQGLFESHDQLVEEVEALRGEFADLQERLDFTERLLARERDPSRIAPHNDVQD
jgi:hypothetical protein